MGSRMGKEGKKVEGVSTTGWLYIPSLYSNWGPIYTFPTSSMTETVEINDAIFCSHLKEVCNDCSYDGREENDAFYGFDPVDRAPIEPPTVTMTKDGVYQCKKHGSTDCGQCFGWKKQITRARVAAKKAGKK